MAERESKIQRRVIDYLRSKGVYVYKNAQNIYTEKGRPDLTACVPTTVGQLVTLLGEDAKVGIFFGIEMKREGKLNNTSEAQEVVGRQIRKAAGMWLVIDDVEQIKPYVENLLEPFEKGGTNAV